MPERIEREIIMNAPAAAPPAGPAEQNHYELVRASRLSERLSDDETAVLAGVLTLARYVPGQVLASEGVADKRLHAIVDGSLLIVKHVGTPDETVLATLNAGDFAHGLGFLDDEPRYASLLATNSMSGRALVLEREKLESLIQTHPRVLYGVMCAIVRSVHQVQTRMAMQAIELTNYIVKQHGRY